MNELTLDELNALRLVLKFVSVSELLIAAEDGFAAKNTVLDRDRSDICYKAYEAFLKK